MKVAIIGAGKVGGSIATGLSRKGHQIVFGARDPADADVKTLSTKLGATAALPREAAAGADVVVLSLPWGAAEAAVKSLGELSGKIVIDCMNPVGMVNGALGLALGYSTSAGETVQAWLPGARVVINHIGLDKDIPGNMGRTSNRIARI